MQKRERRLTALLLGCLALVSAAVTAWVCLKEQPGNVAAFETRFLDVSGMGFEAGEGLALEALPDALTLRWEAGEGAERSAASAAVPLEPGTREATLTVYASGTQEYAEPVVAFGALLDADVPDRHVAPGSSDGGLLRQYPGEQAVRHQLGVHGTRLAPQPRKDIRDIHGPMIPLRRI